MPPAARSLLERGLMRLDAIVRREAALFRNKIHFWNSRWLGSFFIISTHNLGFNSLFQQMGKITKELFLVFPSHPAYFFNAFYL